MTVNPNQEITSNFRHERKFLITELTKHDVESLIKLHPALFSEIHHFRFVNNIYFDTANLQYYYDNIEGSTSRVKVRIRWYGELIGMIEHPTLEIKIKKGLLGTKKSIKLNSFSLNDKLNLCELLGSINEINYFMNIDFSSLNPVLLNRYSRNYYQSADGKYRITCDNNQSFYKFWNHGNSFLNQIDDKNTVILELKYNKEFDSGVNYITSRFPFRLSKSSKYITGIQKLFDLT